MHEKMMQGMASGQASDMSPSVALWMVGLALVALCVLAYLSERNTKAEREQAANNTLRAEVAQPKAHSERLAA